MVQESKIIRNTFYIQLVALIVADLTQTIGKMIDGIIIGKYLGVESIAAYGIISPLMSIFSVFGTIVSTGSRNCFTRTIGKGKTNEAQGIFSLSLLFSLFTSVLLMIIIFLFPSEITSLLGASRNVTSLFIKARDYLIGIAIGLPAINMMSVLVSYLPIDSDRNLPIISAIVLTVSNIVLDLLVVFYFHIDTFGMALTTSISYYLAVLVLLFHFRKKNIILHLNIKSIKTKYLKEIAIQGSPIAMCQVGYIVRVAYMNRLLASLATSSVIAAYSVYQQADNFLCALTIGMANTVAIMSGILVGEEDRPRMKRLLLTSLQATLFITLGVAVLSYLLAPQFSSLFITNDNVALSYSIRAVRTYAIGMPLYGLSLIYFNYFQGIGKPRLSSITGILSEAGLLIFSAWFLSFFFKENAVWYSFVMTQILMLILYVIIIFVYSYKHNLKHMSFWDKILLLPKTFDVNENDRIDLSVNQINEVTLLSQTVREFCLSHGCDKKRAYHMSLAVEEMVGNVIEHGFTKDNKKHNVDVRIIKKDNNYILRIRDDCYIFDPKKQLELYSDDDPIHHLGLKIIIATAKEFQYTCILKLNNLYVRI